MTEELTLSFLPTSIKIIVDLPVSLMMICTAMCITFCICEFAVIYVMEWDVSSGTAAKSERLPIIIVLVTFSHH